MIRTLTVIPSPILFKKAQVVEKTDQKIIDLILDMVETFKVQDHPKAVGLAANQVGRPEKIFLALIDKRIVPFINPEIIEVSKELLKTEDPDDRQLEGCLSIPGYFGEVTRPLWVKIKYQTIKLSSSGAANRAKRRFDSPEVDTKTEIFKGFPATIIQHEMDHLEGKVFTEKLLSQKGKLYKVVMGKDGKEEFDEVLI